MMANYLGSMAMCFFMDICCKFVRADYRLPAPVYCLAVGVCGCVNMRMHTCMYYITTGS